jgi:7-carboxy-7-deazaguanine synthase
MSKIKVAELFYSLQGEGQYLGTPSIFLRVFGCNFQCAGFSMPRGQKSEERLAVDPSKYEKYEDLPLVHTGCDSYASWDVRFKKLSPMRSVEQIADKIQELLPGGKFSHDKHLILTGGEPLLGWQRSYIDLFEEFKKRDMNLSHITFETNGTQMIQPELYDYLNAGELDITFSVSSKLPSSGEAWEDAIKPHVINQYYWLGTLTYFKWVVSSEEDYADVVRAVEEYGKDDVCDMNDIPVYLMPAGGTTMHYDNNERWVADLAMKNGWRYTPRLQVQLWKNAWGT